MEDYGLREACGVFGCVSRTDGPSGAIDVAPLIQLGLVGLQHRGQESVGIVTSSGEPGAKFSVKKHAGLVNTLKEEDTKGLSGRVGIGHVRYSTQGGTGHENIQPFVVETLHGLIAVAHNGELVNAKSLRKKLLKHGVGLSTGSDSELLTQLLTHQPPCGEPNGANWLGRIEKMMEKVTMSYSLLVMLSDRIYAVRDTFGNRPLCLGKLLPASALGGTVRNTEVPESEVEGWLVSSESCAFSAVGTAYYREVLPGEVIEISNKGIRSCMIVRPPKDNPSPAFCFFEYVYFARPDSIFEGQTVYSVRKRCGTQLALEAPVEADVVSSVPDTSTPAAMEYARALNIPYQSVFFKNTYVGRTFLQPTPRLRHLGVAKKFGPLYENIEGKRIVLIDDSIVRGTTMGSIVRLLKRSDAKEVHVRVASPPIKHPCYMGINIPTREELVANNLTLEEIRELIGADSLHYLSLEGIMSAIGKVDTTGRSGHCFACLNGEYPVAMDW